MTHTTADEGPRSKQREAWDGDPPHRTAARERLLEVAASCVARDGISGTGIAHVALEAGVSRPTVYRYFKDREELIRSVLLQAGLRLANEVQEHIRGFEGLAKRSSPRLSSPCAPSRKTESFGRFGSRPCSTRPC